MKDKPVEESKSELDNRRHSLAHLLAAAVLDIYPDALPTIGPSTKDGFYYDFDFGDNPISEDDLKKIQKKMRKMQNSWSDFEEKVVSEDEAREYFADSPYKLELIDEISSAGETITLYTSGEGSSEFTDLCRGGHIKDMQEIDPKSYELDSLAGAYWRGDENNAQLTRIYGLAFGSPESLQKFKEERAEAMKRDHRKLGRELKLFTFSDLVGPGLPMLLPHGETLRESLVKFIVDEKKKRNYQFVKIPHIARRELYEKSGHMGKYDAMMPSMVDQNDDEYVLKAMNCPHHFEIYNSQLHSYRDLPLRIAENTTVYRNEKSGELHGLTRVKNLTQDDTHHFIRPDQIESEIEMILDLMEVIYSRLEFKDYTVQISVRDPQTPDKYFGEDKLWDEAEEKLIKSVKEWGAEYVIEEGEAAFYGPKIDIMITDAIGRQWQLTTVQLDFNQPKNFDMSYVGEDGEKHSVVVIHAAIYGSFERFMGVLIEHFAGAFPLWLAPEQVRILPIADDHHNYANEVRKQLTESSFRVNVDSSNESLGKRIRNVNVNKVPYFIVIGDNEMENKSLTLESRNDGKIGEMSLENLIERLQKETDYDR